MAFGLNVMGTVGSGVQFDTIGEVGRVCREGGAESNTRF